MQEILEKLYRQEDLSREESQRAFKKIVGGEVNEIVLSSLLTALKIKGETPQEIAGAAQAMREAAVTFPKPDYPIADIVGTGGDGANTINISTTSVFVAAAAGVKVCKHGNRSVSSKSGAADLLERLGVNLAMSPQQARHCLDTAGCCFIFAPQYHSGVRHAMPVRQALKSRTIFNILGPLINPALPEVMLAGVYSAELIRPYAEALRLLGVKRAMVVHGDGLDEIALHGETQVAEIDSGEIREYRLQPNNFGLGTYPLEALRGGEPEQNADMTRAILRGEGEPAHEAAVTANAGALIYLAGRADSLLAGAEKAKSVITTGHAFDVMSKMAELSNA